MFEGRQDQPAMITWRARSPALLRNQLLHLMQKRVWLQVEMSVDENVELDENVASSLMLRCGRCSSSLRWICSWEGEFIVLVLLNEWM